MNSFKVIFYCYTLLAPAASDDKGEEEDDYELELSLRYDELSFSSFSAAAFLRGTLLLPACFFGGI